MSEEIKDDGSFETIDKFESDLGVRHQENGDTTELVCQYHQKLDPSEFVNDEFVNRFEPVLSNLIHSEEEMARFLKAIGIPDDNGMVLYHVRSLLNNEQSGPDEDLEFDMDQISKVFKAKVEEVEAIIRKDEAMAGVDEEDFTPIARAYTLLMLNGYC